MKADDFPENGDHNNQEESVYSYYLADSKTSQLDDVLNEKLETAFHRHTSQLLSHNIAKIASEHDPIDLAYAVTRLPPNARVIVYENLPDLSAKIIFMIHTGGNTRAAIFRQIDDHEIKSLLENMPPDEAVAMLDNMSDRRMKRVLDLLDPKRSVRIRELQKHDRNSAGRLMTNEFFAFHMNTTVGEVVASIRDNPGIDLTRRIFVLDDEGELAGFVPGRNLIVNSHEIPLRQIMRPILHKVNVDTPREEVIDYVERYEIPALPVVDKQDHLIGVITYKDVVEAMEDIAGETIATIAGTAEDISEHEPTFKRFLWRAPWLLVTLLAGLVTATALTHFNDRAWFIVVPFFVPLINMMSGNVGLQSSTLLVRGMSTGELPPGSRRKAIINELKLGLLIGIIFGVTCGTIVYLFGDLGFNHLGKTPLILGATVSCGILTACLTATTLGAFSPFVFARFHIDPAVASGPLVTAFNDVLSTLMFFLVAFGINRLLG